MFKNISKTRENVDMGNFEKLLSAIDINCNMRIQSMVKVIFRRIFREYDSNMIFMKKRVAFLALLLHQRNVKIQDLSQKPIATPKKRRIDDSEVVTRPVIHSNIIQTPHRQLKSLEEKTSPHSESLTNHIYPVSPFSSHSCNADEFNKNIISKRPPHELTSGFMLGKVIDETQDRRHFQSKSLFHDVREGVTTEAKVVTPDTVEGNVVAPGEEKTKQEQAHQSKVAPKSVDRKLNFDQYCKGANDKVESTVNDNKENRPNNAHTTKAPFRSAVNEEIGRKVEAANINRNTVSPEERTPVDDEEDDCELAKDTPPTPTHIIFSDISDRSTSGAMKSTKLTFRSPQELRAALNSSKTAAMKLLFPSGTEGNRDVRESGRRIFRMGTAELVRDLSSSDKNDVQQLNSVIDLLGDSVQVMQLVGVGGSKSTTATPAMTDLSSYQSKMSAWRSRYRTSEVGGEGDSMRPPSAPLTGVVPRSPNSHSLNNSGNLHPQL